LRHETVFVWPGNGCEGYQGSDQDNELAHVPLDFRLCGWQIRLRNEPILCDAYQCSYPTFYLWSSNPTAALFMAWGRAI